MGDNKVYLRSGTGPFRQSEVISNFREPRAGLDSLKPDGAREISIITHELVMVLSQDCDLESIDRALKESREPAHTFLICDVYPAEDLHATIKVELQVNNKEWKLLQQNRDERFQFLQAVLPEDDLMEKGSDALAMDFRRFFTIPPEYVYFQVDSGSAQRRFRLASPYQEHVACRFFAFQSRIAIPEPHAG